MKGLNFKPIGFKHCIRKARKIFQLLVVFMVIGFSRGKIRQLRHLSFKDDFIQSSSKYSNFSTLCDFKDMYSIEPNVTQLPNTPLHLHFFNNIKDNTEKKEYFSHPKRKHSKRNERKKKNKSSVGLISFNLSV